MKKAVFVEKFDLSDLSLVAEKFSNAMYNDPLHVYFFPNAKTRRRKIYSLYYYMVRMNYLNAHRTSEACEGIVLWEKPYEHEFKVGFKNFLIGSTLFFKVGPFSLLRMMKYQIWSAKLKKEYINDPFWYLSVVIVDPNHQGKGFASKLIKPILTIATQNEHKVYLETQNTDNVPIYEKYGFKVVSMQKIPGTEIIHLIMIRD